MTCAGRAATCRELAMPHARCPLHRSLKLCAKQCSMITLPQGIKCIACPTPASQRTQCHNWQNAQ
eukprot:3166104-Amphidinium_carterae.1